MATYAFDNAWHTERQRLALLEATLDPGTIQRFDALKIGRGWDCLEIGALEVVNRGERTRARQSR